MMTTMLTADLDQMPLRVQRRVVIDPDTGCWNWTGRLNANGYGVVSFGGQLATYVLCFLLVHGDVPGDGDGMCLDHLCRNRLCCNPAHLEIVTFRENTLRGETIPAAHAAKTHCPLGHSYDEANTYWYRNRRTCRKCRVIAVRKYHNKKRTRHGQ